MAAPDGDRPNGGTVGRTLAESTPTFTPPPSVREGAPNVVVIVLDDLGFADLGCYGSHIATPTIDRLAAHGLRYNNFHVTAICSATRACVLTGRNHHAVGMGFLNFPIGFPGYTSRIPKSAATLARVLRDSGYNTFAVGKWHLTPRPEMTPAGPFDRWPLAMGFERYYGFLDGSANQWTPELVRDNGAVDVNATPGGEYHLTEDLASQAIRLVQDQQQAAPDKPFFLYFAPGAMHFPHHAPASWIEAYRDQFDSGWDLARQETFRRQLDFGVVPPNTVLPRRPSWVAAWDDLSPDERKLYARMMEIYAGFLSHTDAQIGRLLDFLAMTDQLENTVLLVLSDNGASADGGPHGAVDAATYFQSNDVDSMVARIDELGGPRSYNHYAWGWAWAGNTPFRLWKHYTWLGGVRVPMVVHWPKVISAQHHGRVRGQFCHAIDLMPTILEAAGIEPPDAVDGVSQQPVDGKSILESFTHADAASPRDTQYFEMMGSRAVYHDGWKATTDHVVDIPAQRMLVRGAHDVDDDRWALFNLAADFAESEDVAASNPGRLRQLIELWWHEAGRNQVLPLIDGSLQERLTAMEPPLRPVRREYVYRPGGGAIEIPSLRGGFRLVAELDVPEDVEPAGIVCANGDWNGGWAFYVLDRRPVATFTFRGTSERVVSAEPLRSGSHELGVSYLPSANSSAGVTLTIDGLRVGTGTVPALPKVFMGKTKFVVGRDTGFPVCDDYRAPFAFRGDIHRVVLEVPDAAPEHSRDDIDAALRND